MVEESRQPAVVSFTARVGCWASSCLLRFEHQCLAVRLMTPGVRLHSCCPAGSSCCAVQHPHTVCTAVRLCCCLLRWQAVRAAVSRLPAAASLSQVEGDVIEAVQKAARWFNNRKPEVIAVAWEHDPRSAILPDLAARQGTNSPPRRPSAPPGALSV